MSWYENLGSDMDVVISSRIRLARNFKNIPFQGRITEEASKEILQQTKGAILNDKTILSTQFDFLDFANLNDIEKVALVERYIASQELTKHPFAGLLLSKDERISIMINEEDHIRLQVLYPGFQLHEAWNYADKIDNVLEESIEYAFDETYGYLTSCPTNVGTGLRASVMLHLPGLEISQNIPRILDSISKFGLTVRGMYGEGTEAVGSLYQISNQITLGQSEIEMIDHLTAIVKQIIEQERQIRNTFLRETPAMVEDRVYRAYGILKYARQITAKEAIRLLSDVKIGIDLNILKEVDLKTIMKLFMGVQAANIQITEHGILDERRRNIKRAELIRKHLP